MVARWLQYITEHEPSLPLIYLFIFVYLLNSSRTGTWPRQDRRQGHIRTRERTVPLWPRYRPSIPWNQPKHKLLLCAWEGKFKHGIIINCITIGPKALKRCFFTWICLLLKRFNTVCQFPSYRILLFILLSVPAPLSLAKAFNCMIPSPSAQCGSQTLLW